MHGNPPTTNTHILNIKVQMCTHIQPGIQAKAVSCLLMQAKNKNSRDAQQKVFKSGAEQKKQQNNNNNNKESERRERGLHTKSSRCGKMLHEWINTFSLHWKL